MSDGSNMGITAKRALGTILGGDDQPTEEEKATPEQVRARVMAAPDPCEGLPIWEREGDGYSLSADAISKAFLLAEEADPGILERRECYPEDCEHEILRGVEKDGASVVWDYVSDRWPGFDSWIGGASGFQVGFAYNTARYVTGQRITGNPAILDIEVPAS